MFLLEDEYNLAATAAVSLAVYSHPRLRTLCAYWHCSQISLHNGGTLLNFSEPSSCYHRHAQRPHAAARYCEAGLGRMSRAAFAFTVLPHRRRQGLFEEAETDTSDGTHSEVDTGEYSEGSQQNLNMGSAPLPHSLPAAYQWLLPLPHSSIMHDAPKSGIHPPLPTPVSNSQPLTTVCLSIFNYFY